MDWVSHYQSWMTNKDITERKVLEDRLRVSEARFRTAMDNLVDGFAILAAVRVR
jgi:PAS domain-containing protein